MRQSTLVVLLTVIMAFAAITGGTSAQSKTANQASTTIAPDQTYAVGNLLILLVAVDNNSTTNGADEGAVSTITDTGGNTWTKAKENTNNGGSGSAQNGAVCSFWYCQLTTQLTTGDTITVNFTNSTSRDASALSLKGFTLGAGNNVAIEGTPANAQSSQALILNVTTSNIECLRIRGIGAESNSSTALTPTTNWTALPGNQTSGGSAVTNMAVRGEFRISTGTSDNSTPTWTTGVDMESIYVAFKEVASGTLFTQNVGGTVTVSGNVVKADQQKKTGSITPGGTARLTKITSKPLTGSSTVSGAIARQTSKPLAGSASISGALAALRLKTQGLAGSITPTAIVKKAVSIFRGGSMAATGAMVRSVAKPLAGSSTPSGALAKAAAFARTLTGSISPSAALKNQAAKLVAGSSTPTGSLVRSDSKKLAGSSTPAGAIANSASIVKGGSTTPSGAAAFLKLLAKSLAGQVSPSAVLKNAVLVFRSGSSTPAGAIVKNVSQKKGGSLTPSAAIANLKVALKSVGGSLSPSGVLTRSTSQKLAGSISPSAIVAKFALVKKSASAAISGAIANLNSPTLHVAGSSTPGGSVQRSASRTFAGSIAIAGSLQRSISNVLRGAISLAGSLINQLLGETVTGDGRMFIVRANKSELRLATAGSMTILHSARTRLRLEVQS